MRDFGQLSREYKRSSGLIYKRITLLKSIVEELERKKEEDKAEELKTRIKALQEIHRTTREIGIEVENYYKEGWWRSEKYTTNGRKSRLPVLYYGFIVRDEDGYKRETDSAAEENFEKGCRERVKLKTEKDLINVLLREEKSKRDSLSVKHSSIECI